MHGVVESRCSRVGRGRRAVIVEIRIGIANTGRELTFESAESADAVKHTISSALESGAALVTLTDSRGATYLVPTSGIAFVEVGTDHSRRVGFVA